MKSIKLIGTFIAGAVIGGCITGLVVKKKYEDLIDEEIQSVKDVYKERYGNKEVVETKIKVTEVEEEDGSDRPETADIKKYHEERNNKEKINYSGYYEKSEIKTEFKDLSVKYELFLPPTLIDEEEVGMDGFDMQVLTYYSDDVLVDENDKVMDIEKYIGLENVRIFNDDLGCRAMFVRNDELGIDYEIQRDDMTWEDFATQMGISYDNYK